MATYLKALGLCVVFAVSCFALALFRETQVEEKSVSGALPTALMVGGLVLVTMALGTAYYLRRDVSESLEEPTSSDDP